MNPKDIENSLAEQDFRGQLKEEKIREFIGQKVIYDEGSGMIFGVKDGKQQLILDLRGWGAIQNLFRGKPIEEAAKFQDALGEWIIDAINKKLQSTSLRLDGDKNWEKIESDFRKRFISTSDSLHQIEGAMSVFDWIKEYFGSLSSDEKGVTGLQSEWVRVEKELPTKVCNVYVYADGKVRSAIYSFEDKSFWYGVIPAENVTHWRLLTLPSPPINKSLNQ